MTVAQQAGSRSEISTHTQREKEESKERGEKEEKVKRDKKMWLRKRLRRHKQTNCAYRSHDQQKQPVFDRAST